ncbi:MAG: extracellular solute-binding protein [Treponemataceae bacterium]|nr:extracellular solute-binding protein [Treponemataceae bacterium]
MKVLFLLLVSWIAVSCAPKKAKENQGAFKNTTSVFSYEQSLAPFPLPPPGKLPLVTEPFTFRVFIPSVGFIADLQTNAYVRWIEEQTGIHIEWIETDRVSARNKLMALLASEEYPDIIFGANGTGLSSQDIYRYGRTGVFLPLEEFIEKEGYWIKELFEAEPAIKKIITSPDGHIYGLPAVFTDDYHMTMRQKAWINKKWLDRLGLAVPKTLDDLYRVLQAFKRFDANGNGDPTDEIPMAGATRNLENVVLWLMNSFVPAGGPDDSGDPLLNNFEFIIDGKVFFSATTKEYQEGLRFIRRLFREGLVDSHSLVQDRSRLRSFVEGPVNRLGVVVSHHPANVATLSEDPRAPVHEYVVLPPLIGPGGKAYTPWLIDAVIKVGELVITKQCRYPQLAFRWADHFYRLESALHDKGIEGVHWERLPEGKFFLAFNGKPAKYRYLKPLTQEDNAQLNMGPGWTRDLKNEFAIDTGFSYEELLYRSTQLYEPFKVRRYPFSTVSISDRDFGEFYELRRTIHSFVMEASNRFIVGELDIDQDWPLYLRQLEQLGLSRYLSILEKNL